MNCGRSSSVEWKLPKLQRRVRFPSPAPPPPGCAPGGFVMPPRQARLACRTHFGRPNRYKTLPTHAPGRRYRYKTLPARAKTPIVAHFQHAGRTLYRFHHQQVEQGELCTARGADAGTKLSPLTPLAGDTGTKLSRLAPKRPLWPIFSMQGELYTAFTTNRSSRENFVPHAGPMPVQNSPSSQPSGRHRYKTLPAPPKWPISARFTPAGRTLYRFHHPHDEQGEKSPAPTLHLTHQRAPPTISHAIRLLERSTIPRNVAIPTI